MSQDLALQTVPGVPDGPLAARVIPSKKRRAELAGQVARFIYELVQLEPLSPEFGYQVEAIHKIGEDEIRALTARNANLTHRFAVPPCDVIGDAIHALQDLAHDLDPMREGNLLNPIKRFGLFRTEPDPETYFQRYLAAQDRIEASLQRLAKERDAMLRANVTFAAERVATLKLLRELEEAGVTARELADGIEARAIMLEASDPVRAQRLRSDAEHEARGRAQEIMTQMTLGAQGWMALELLETNNAKLIEGANQAIDTMVLVLRSATMVAEPLTRHGLVLDRIAALNQAASNVITEDHKDGTEEPKGTTEALQSAFSHLYEALGSTDLDNTRCRNELAEAVARMARGE